VYAAALGSVNANLGNLEPVSRLAVRSVSWCVRGSVHCL